MVGKQLGVFAIATALTLFIFAASLERGGEAFTNASAQKETTTTTDTGAMTMNMTGGGAAGGQTMANETHTTTVVRDSATVLLEGKSIPAKSYIHLYDTTPYMIMSGHIAAKLPCDSGANPILQILIGSAPNFRPADFELIRQLSQPGNLCLYHVNLASSPSPSGGGNATILTDIALSNPTNTDISFPPTSTVVIGVNEIMPGAEGGGSAHAHDEATTSGTEGGSGRVATQGETGQGQAASGPTLTG